MQTPKEWTAAPDVFDIVASAMMCYETDDIYHVRASDEVDGHGDLGTITFKTRDGRRWKLLLAELT
jgi:hypothetical protein